MNDYVLVYLLTYRVVLQKNGIINEVKPENISISFNCLTTRWQWHLLRQRFKNYLDKVCNIRHAHCMGKASTWTKETKEVPGWISGDRIWFLLHVSHFLKWINAILLWFQNKKVCLKICRISFFKKDNVFSASWKSYVDANR